MWFNGEEKAKIRDSFVRIAILTLIIEFMLAFGFYFGVRYGLIGVGESKVIIINPAHAEGKNGASGLQPKNEWEMDCFDAIDAYTLKNGGDAEIAKRIVDAESGGRYQAENGSSTATGCFQFINGTWRNYGKKLWGDEFYKKNIYNPKDNVELGMWTLKMKGTTDWDASKSVWQK